MFASRRRRPWPVVLLFGVGLLPVLWVMGATDGLGRLVTGGSAPTASVAAPVQLAPDARRAPSEVEQQAATTPVLAVYDGLELHLPTPRPVVVGFHEAATSEALEMRPVGSLVENENTTKFEPPAASQRGPDYLVLSSRGRVHAATSAVDVVMRGGDPVRSPVDGVVTDVRDYVLYGNHRDTRIEIEPEGRPELRVVVIHVEGTAVAVGDEVRSGETVLADTARPFPFGSQIDRYTEPDRFPHVHIEVKLEDDTDDDEPA